MNSSALDGMEATRTLGKYTLVRHLATGGMAEIWLAEQAGPGGFNKELVIKQILPHLARDESFTKMFLDEARLAAQLSHPKIAQIYELGQAGEEYFIAMEFIDGMDLSDLVETTASRGEVMPLGIASKVIIDVLEALDYAHDYTDRDGTPYNLVHRDVTPHNVIVSNDGIVKLVDFGVAKAKANQSKTQTGAVKGKYAYMAPEQIQSQEIDRRVDIFAAGVLFYELLAGQKPFGEDLAAVTNILTQPTPSVCAVRTDLPEAVNAVIQKATAKNADDRYIDAHDMLRDVESLLREHAGYVGDREVAAYIRQVQGLPTTRHTAAQSKARSQPQPQQDDSSPKFDHMTPEPSPHVTGTNGPIREKTQEEIMLENIETGAMPSVEMKRPAEIRTDTVTSESVLPADDGGGSNGGLIAVFAILFLVVTAVGGYLFYTMVYLKKQPETETPVVSKKEPVHHDAPKVDPTFDHGSEGVIVSVSCKPVADVYYKGKKVGTTPISTRLRQGEYEIEFKSKSVNKTKTFEVSASKLLNRVTCK